MSNETKHTPGPWIACLNVPTAVIEGHIIKANYDPKRPIASLWVGGGTKGKPEQVANARLIAAAPDMLKALKAVNTEYTLHGSLTDSHRLVKRAIEKAEGE